MNITDFLVQCATQPELFLGPSCRDYVAWVFTCATAELMASASGLHGGSRWITLHRTRRPWPANSQCLKNPHPLVNYQWGDTSNMAHILMLYAFSTELPRPANLAAEQR
jgi:hypothetical protein